MTNRGSVTVDEYERRFMNAEGALFRERILMVWWGHVLFMLALARSLYAGVERGYWLGVVLVPLVWLLVMALRVTLTPETLHVQLGILGPKIPVAAIERVGVAGPRFRTGWGVRLGLDGSVTYSLPSRAKGLVAVTYRGKRRRKVVYFSSADPTRMVEEIDRARARVRVAEEGAPPALEEAMDVVEDSFEDADRRSRRANDS